MTGRGGPDDRELEVRVTGGTVRGVREGGVLAWRGMPYAAPPVGESRFAAPAPVRSWHGVRDASEFGPIAPQTLLKRLVRPSSLAADVSEDCLTVNVYAPATVSPTGSASASASAASRAGASDPLPVMVFIHGGGYSAGSSRDFSGQGERFVGSGRVVYVSFNYRLGPLGYLDFSSYSTPERRFDSNLGLRDQVALLRWVRRNIGAFGGDPENVTVLGESAGGNAVTTLMATPAAHGLFARAIAQSPPPKAVYSRALAEQWAEEYLELLQEVVGESEGVENDDDDPRGIRPTAGELLMRAEVHELIEASVMLQAQTPDAHPGEFCLAPVVDGEFLPEQPLRAFRDGRAHRVPLIIGTNDREGSIFRGRADILPRTPDRIAAMFDRAPAPAREVMRLAYPGLPAPRAAADFGGDYGFWYPSTRVADFHSRYAPVWSYRFDFAPRLLKLVGIDATHGVEMFALFDHADEPLARVMTSLGGSEAYAEAGERMRELWLLFAEGALVMEGWPRYDERERSTLVIDEEDRIEVDPRRERRRAWNRFLPALAG
jgi:carboxylesterase type B